MNTRVCVSVTRAAQGLPPVAKLPLLRARTTPVAGSHVSGETIESGREGWRDERIMRDVVRKHPLYEPPYNAADAKRATTGRNGDLIIISRCAPSNTNDDKRKIRRRRRCWPWENDVKERSPELSPSFNS